MTITQQRTYQLPLDREQQDAWLAWWRGVSVPRVKYGFSIKSAVLDRETGIFTWMVSHDGDFAAAEQAYVASPERADVFTRPAPAITVLKISLVDVLV